MSGYTGSVPDSEPGRKWLEQAACRQDGIDPEMFFPDNNVHGIDAARAICVMCPVRQACLVDCMHFEGGRNSRSRWGVYAGLTPRQRYRLYEKFRDRAKRRRGEVAA